MQIDNEEHRKMLLDMINSFQLSSFPGNALNKISELRTAIANAVIVPPAKPIKKK